MGVYETGELNNRQNKIEQYAAQLMKLARDSITVRFRFFDAALAGLKVENKAGLGGFAMDGNKLYYDSAFLLREYMEEPNIAVRAYLHMLLHCIFFHRFQYDKLNEEYWNLATDIAVENIILEMEFAAASLSRDSEALEAVGMLKKRVPEMSAEKLYREFMVNEPTHDAKNMYRRLFSIDKHDGWKLHEDNEIIISEEQWQKIARRIRTDLKTFSKNKTGTESLQKNLDEAVRERYNYRELLEKFTATGEEVTVNDDEFDYVYYTYGLATYGNLPLIEPLEYKEVNKVREFVIAIDTSASCRGDIVKEFVKRTYEILKGTETFFHKVNVHIIQCDAEIKSDVKLENDEDFREFIAHGELKGFGATDLRPLFDYVDELIEHGEFENLKGLIYFTDGYGIYPDRMPDYDVIFAFLNEDENRHPVPGWAIKVVMEDELSEY